MESTHLADKDGKILAIFCYYHKQWEVVKDVPYGSKASHKTGLNTMCKVGTSQWTKDQKTARDAEAQLLSDVASGKVEPSKILTLKAEIEAKRQIMSKIDMPKGFKSEAEVLKHLKQ